MPRAQIKDEKTYQALRREGLSAEVGDAVGYLESRPPGSLGAVTAFQLVEHWAPADAPMVWGPRPDQPA